MEITTESIANLTEQRFLKWLYWIGFILSAVAVLMQMNEVHGGFVTNYVADIGGPIWFYSMIRQRKVLFKKVLPDTTPLFSAIFVFSIGTAWEICQAFDFSGTPLAITRGRFDPFDILCYALSLTACYFFDKYYSRERQTSSSAA